MSCICDSTIKDTDSRVIHYGSEHIFTGRSASGTVTIKSAGSEQLLIDSDSQQAPMPWIYDSHVPFTQVSLDVYARNYEYVDTVESSTHAAHSLAFSEDCAYLGFNQNNPSSTPNFNYLDIWRRTGDSWALDYTTRFDKCSSIFPGALDYNIDFVVQGNDYICVTTNKSDGSEEEPSYRSVILENGSWTTGATSNPDYNQLYVHGTTMVGGYHVTSTTLMSQELSITGTTGSFSVTGDIVEKSLLGFYNDTAVYVDSVYRKSGSWAFEASIPTSTMADIIDDTLVIGDGTTIRWLTRTGGTWTSRGSISIAHVKLKLLDDSNFCMLNTAGTVKVYNITVVSGTHLVATIETGLGQYLAVGGTSRADKTSYIATSSNTGTSAYTCKIYKYTGLGELIFDGSTLLQKTYNYECYTEIENTDMSLGSMAFSPDSKYFAIGDGYATPAGAMDYNALRIYKNSETAYENMETLVYNYSKTGAAFQDYSLSVSIAVSGNDYIVYSGSWSLTATDTTRGYKLENGSWVLKYLQFETDYKPYLFTQTSGSVSMVLSNVNQALDYSVNTNAVSTELRTVRSAPFEILDFYADTVLFKDAIFVYESNESGGSWSEQLGSVLYDRGSLLYNTVVWTDSNTLYWYTRTAGTWTLTSSHNTGFTIVDVRLLSTSTSVASLVAIVDSRATVHVYEMVINPSVTIRLAGSYRTCLSYPKLITSGGSSNSERSKYIAIGSSQTNEPLISAVIIIKLSSTTAATSTQAYSSIYVTGSSISLAPGSGIYGSVSSSKGSVYVTNTTNSTSVTNGSMIVSGGLAVVRDVNVSSMSMLSRTSSTVGLAYGSLVSVTHASTSMTSSSLLVTGSINMASCTMSDLSCTSVRSIDGTWAPVDYVQVSGLGSQSIGSGASTKLDSGYWTGQTVSSGSLMTVTDGYITVPVTGLYTCTLSVAVPYNAGGTNPYVRAGLAITDSGGLDKNYVSMDSVSMDSSVDPMILNCMTSVPVNAGSRIQAEILQVSGSSLSMTSSTASILTVSRGPLQG